MCLNGNQISSREYSALQSDRLNEAHRTQHTAVMSHKMMSSCWERGRNPRSTLMIWVKCASNFAAVHKRGKDASLLKEPTPKSETQHNRFK